MTVTISDPGAKIFARGEVITPFTLTASPDDTYTWTKDYGLYNLSVNASTGVCSGTIGEVPDGDYPTRVRATGLLDDGIIDIAITIEGGYPVVNIDYIANQVGMVGVPITPITATVITEEEDTFTWTEESDFPPGVSMNTSTGVISGTPTTAGEYYPVISVLGTLGSPYSDNGFAFTVTAPPVIIAPPPVAAEETADVVVTDVAALTPSSRFCAAAAFSHQVIVYAEVLINGQVVYKHLPVVDGSVHADRNNIVRRTADIMIGDRSLVPKHPTDPLAPYGQEIRINRGIRYSDGTQELITIFLGGIQSAQWDADFGAVRVRAADRMQRLVDSKTYQMRSVDRQWPHPNNNAQKQALFVDIIENFYPHALYPIPETYTMPINFPPGVDLALRTPVGKVVEEDPLQEIIVPLLKNWGCEMYAGVDGFLHIVKVPDVRNVSAAYTVQSGESGVLVSAEAGLSREGAVNFITVFSNPLNGSTPVWWTTRDANPNSPTYGRSLLRINGEYTEEGILAGQFGRQSKQIRSETAQTIAQCKIEAETELKNNLGSVHSLSFTALPMEWIAPGNGVQIQFPGFSETHLVDNIDIPLNTKDGISAGTRSYTLPLT